MTFQTRLTRLREALSNAKLDGFIIPLTDEHMSEYVGAYARRLEWLTGFQGSAGSAVVLADRAAIFVDGRYTVQVRAQVDGALYEYRSVPAEPPHLWIAEQAGEGARIGYDPWLTTRAFLRTAEAALAPKGIALVPVASNPVDGIWDDQPAPSTAPAEALGDEFTGRPSADKRRAIAAELKKAGADAVLLSALDSIAWLFNIRGTDISRTPVVRAFAILRADGSATLYTDPVKIPAEVKAHLGPDVAIEPYDAFGPALERLEGTVMLDPAWSVAAIFEALGRGKARVVEARDPTTLPKAAKNPTELAGMRAAHVRDGAAISRFLHSLDTAPPADELDASDRLEAFRRESNLLKDLSFDSISAIGPNAALPHYHSEPATNRAFAGEQIYLIDSGGQYPDGTTDITRTVAIGTPTAEMQDRYTRVLKGHIALATARFPKGTRGGQLDILARQFLWAAGLDYAHGTGHGVGHYLSVHEGPQRIAAAVGAPGVEEVLLPGMLLSNEPGYYKVGEYGIRIENLVIVREDPRPGDLEPMLAFETITLAPIDKRLVEPALMTEAEIEWFDQYHARVREALQPLLSGAAKEWLLDATAPLLQSAQAAA
ncbi:aminopeptidase P family protein [Sandaracinobacter sp. RS1-74]|uniref:aminopeptidase P family protein n=1 Tax=Sandaracinobacteroides sayramensis TaxID=2913411 RepID=UPI001ED9EBDB|nr:aminopeptidase P family protein [Sandaracinobacteroides sayramensis]MCG2839608.1 aminopeptidase P family protein [Sandaracinobacteroides sayramensis]